MTLDQNQIKKQAKQILDKFASALAKIEKEHDVDFYVDREEFERKEGEGKKCDAGFKKGFLENAPQHDDDFIIAERGKWG